MGIIVNPSTIGSTTYVSNPSSVVPARTPSIWSTSVVYVPSVDTTTSTSKLPTDVRIYRGYEGPQLIIKWEPPSVTQVEGYVLIRREYDFPSTPSDGITVFNTDESPFITKSYVELPVSFYEEKGILGKGIVENKVYFYQFFSKEVSTGKWITDDSCRIRGFALKTGYFEDKLWQTLPDLYRAKDSEVDERMIALDTTQDNNGEYFNIYETGEKKGQLQRYLKDLAPVLDEAKGLVDSFYVMLDVDNTDPMFLAPMGKLLGVDFNDDIPITQAREEVKNAVPWYKRKGTHPGNELYGYMISRVDCISRAFVDNVLISTRNTDSLRYTYNESVDLTDPVKRYNFELPGDVTGFSEDFVHKTYITPEIVTASSEQAGFEARYAADKSEESFWRPETNEENPYIQFTFTEEKLPTWVRVYVGDGVKDFALEHSYDGTNWYRDSEYKTGCFTKVSQQLGIFDGTNTEFYARKPLIEELPEERVYSGVLNTNALAYLTKKAVPSDTIIEVSDSSFLAKGDWIQIRNGNYVNSYQIMDLDGNRIEIVGTVMMPNGFPEYSTHVRKITTQLKYPYGYVIGEEDYSGDNLNTKTLEVSIDGGSTQTITFSGFDEESTAYKAALFISTNLTGGSAQVVSNKLRIYSLSTGTDSSVSIIGGSAISELGLDVTIGYGAYDIIRDTGSISIREASFQEDDLILMSYTALLNNPVKRQWYSFRVPVYLREPAKYWRVSPISSWSDVIEVGEVELHGDEYYPRMYRHERIGLYLNLDDYIEVCP